MSFFIHGISASNGYAIAPAHILQRNKLEIIESFIEKSEVTSEIATLNKAIKHVIDEITNVQQTIHKDHNEITAILNSHLQLINDPAISKNPIDAITNKNYTAAWALEIQKKHLIAIFEDMDDSYLSSRKDDIKQIIEKIQEQLLSNKETKEKNTNNLKGKIIVADDLAPSDTIDLQNKGIVGFITESGGPLSHTAILSKSLGIPAIVGLHGARELIVNQETIILDGYKGNILFNPDKSALKHYKKLFKEKQKEKKLLENISNKPSISLDDVKINLQANIETPDDLKIIKKLKPDGIGLYRTEFLYMNRDEFPTEDEHYKTYIKIIKSLNGIPLTIRTVDLGSDKELTSNQKDSQKSVIHNPALGLRGIRLALSNPNIFIPQLKAILRASSKGPVKILLPMVTNLAEVSQTLKLIFDIKATLKKKGYKYSDDIPIGAMIEVPSSAIMSDQFTKKLDFLSIGTNDLIQYTLAIDRLDDEVNYLYNSLDPAVLKLIKNVILSGRKYNKTVSMCGEMAGEPKFTKLLLGMGLRDFSVQPNALLEIKEIIRKTNLLSLPEQVDDFYSTTKMEEQDVLLERLNN